MTEQNETEDASLEAVADLTVPSEDVVPDKTTTVNPLVDLEFEEDNTATLQKDTPRSPRLSPKSPRAPDQLYGKSCFIFDTENPVRLAASAIVHHHACEVFILFCIFINVLFLMIQTPSNKEQGVISAETDATLNTIDLVINCIFTVEMITRSVALGFVKGQGAYLHDAWNILDFVLVMAAWVSDLMFWGEDAPVKPTIFRCLRVLRPLRSMRFFHGLKAILEFLPFLLNVCSFLLFFFCVYGVIGMQLFGGVLSHKCTDSMTAQEHANKTLAGVEFRACPHQVSCVDMARCEVITTETYNWAVVYADDRSREIDYYGYDNIFSAFLTEFIVCTMDEWTALSHPYLYGSSKFSSLVWIFFGTMVVVMGLITSNLFVSVIVYAFSHGKDSMVDPDIAKAMVAKLRSLFTRIDTTGDGEIGVDEVLEMGKALNLNLTQSQLNEIMTEMDFNGSGQVDFAEFCEWWKMETEIGMVFHRAVGMEESVIRGVFDTVDEDGSGALDRTEIAQLSEKLGIALSDQELAMAMGEMDSDGNDNVDFDEFLSWWLSGSSISKKIADAAKGEEVKIRKLFERIDLDGSGKMNLDEIMKIGNNFGISTTRPEAIEIYAEFKLPETQQEALFEDFATWWKSESKHALRLRSEAQNAEMKVRCMFDRVDEDMTGVINTNELIQICENGQLELDAGTAKEVMDEMDKSGNETVDFAEFFVWIYSDSSWAIKVRKIIDQIVYEEDQPGWPFIPGLSPSCHSLISTNSFEYSMVVIVSLNTMIMACEHYEQDEWVTTTLFALELVFAVIYVLESLIKILGLSAAGYFKEGLNQLDFLIAIASVVGLLLPDFKGFAAFRILRLIIKLMRVMRMVKLLSKYDAIVSLLKTVVGSSGMLGALSGFIIFVLGLLSIFAVHTLGTCHVTDPDNFGRFEIVNGTADFNTIGPNFNRYNFYTLQDALITNFQIMTGEDWSVVMFYYMHCYGTWSWVYFIAVFSLTNFVLLNMFVAVILENFEFSHEEKLIKQEQKFLKSQENQDDEHGGGAGSLAMAEDIRNSSAEGRKKSKDLKSKFKMTRFFKRKSNEVEEETGEDWNNNTQVADENAEDLSLWCMTPENCFRAKCYQLAESRTFDNFVLAIILLSSILLAIEGPRNAEYLKGEDTLVAIMDAADYFCIVFFTCEMLIKIVAYGFIGTPKPYLGDRWNILDFIVVTFSLVELIVSAVNGHKEAVSVRVLRLLRVLRPLRMIRRNENMRVVVDALIRCLPTITAVVVLGAMFYLTFAILGVGLYMGKFYRCTDDESLDRAPCEALYGKDSWQNPPFDFDNVFHAIRTLFICSTAEGWVEIMYQAMDVTETGMAPVPNNESRNFIYFWFFMIFGSFFLTNIFIGVLVSFFGESSGTALLTIRQAEWLQTQILCLRTKSRVPKGPPEGSWRRPFYNLAEKPWFETVISVLVAINVIMLMFETVPQSQYKTDLLDGLNLGFLCIFTVEMFMKMIAYTPAVYISDNWSRLDFFIIVIGWAGFVGSFFAFELPGIQALRSLRILRIAMLLKSNDVLRSLFGTLLMSLPPTVNLTCLWLLVFFIYGVLGMQYFWDCDRIPGPEVGFINDNDNFKDILHSMRLLYQVSTGQDFMHLTHELETAGASYAFQYFASFVIISIWMFSNLFVAVLLQNFEINFTTENLELKDEHVMEFKREWCKFSEGPEYEEIKVTDIEELVQSVPAPLSNVVEMDPHWLNRIFFELNLEVGEIVDTSTVGFHELLVVLCLMNASYDGLSFDEQQTKRKVIEDKEKLFAQRIMACCVKSFIAARHPPEEFAGTEQLRTNWAVRCGVARTLLIHTIVRLHKIKQARSRA